MQFVLDCSVAISWCLVDENDDYANAIFKRDFKWLIRQKPEREEKFAKAL